MNPLNPLVTKFCNRIMKSGKKSKAYTLFSQSFLLFLQSLQQGRASSPSANHSAAVEKTLASAGKEPSTPVANLRVHNAVAGDNRAGPLENLLDQIIENCRPHIELRRVRIARITHSVPSQISKGKGETLAVRWIIEFANKKKEKEEISFATALSQELQAAYKKTGGPRQRRNELHKLGEANRTSVRYRWW